MFKKLIVTDTSLFYKVRQEMARRVLGTPLDESSNYVTSTGKGSLNEVVSGAILKDVRIIGCEIENALIKNSELHEVVFDGCSINGLRIDRCSAVHRMAGTITFRDTHARRLKIEGCNNLHIVLEKSIVDDFEIVDCENVILHLSGLGRTQNMHICRVAGMRMSIIDHNVSGMTIEKMEHGIHSIEIKESTIFDWQGDYGHEVDQIVVSYSILFNSSPLVLAKSRMISNNSYEGCFTGHEGWDPQNVFIAPYYMKERSSQWDGA